MERKYEMLESDTIEVCGHVLHRIKSLIDFGIIKKGELGGYIEKESNLSQDGTCWVYDSACVMDDATLLENAAIFDNAIVCDDAFLSGNAVVSGYGRVMGNSCMYEDSTVSGLAVLAGEASLTHEEELTGTSINIDPVVLLID